LLFSAELPLASTHFPPQATPLQSVTNLVTYFLMIPVSSIQQLPIKGTASYHLENERYRTDLFCTLISVLFALVLLVAAGWKFTACNNLIHEVNLKKITYPVDSEGITCGLEAAGHPYLYFTSLEDPVSC